jgi:hypothetical protein
MRFDVYGLGAVGSNILLSLAKQYPDAIFHGYDFDKVEERNVRNQAFYLEHVGVYKCEAMRVILSRFIRGPKYVPHREHINAERPMIIPINNVSVSERHVVIDCFDNMESRKLFECYMGNILHVGFSPEYTAECVWNEGYTAPNDVKGLDICSMSEAILFIHYVIAASSMVISHFLKTGEKRGLLIRRDSKGRMQEVYL